jgi:hypothetical protein
MDKVVINITKKELYPTVLSILSKGLNFAHVTTSVSNMTEVIHGVEVAEQHNPVETAEEIRMLHPKALSGMEEQHLHG